MKLQIRIVYFLLTFLMLDVSKGAAPDNGLIGNLSEQIKTDTIKIKTDTLNLTILPPSSGVQFYRDGIIFNSSSKFGNKIPANHLSFGKEYVCYGILKGNSIENIGPFPSNQPFAFPCEATTFSSDYNTMYFTRYTGKGHTLKIYKAGNYQGNKGQWTFSQTPLNFCSDNSDYTHPALSADGKKLIFSSNRNGSVGGMDLFVSYEKEGTWSEPENLGEAVNTNSDELYPCLDTENNLYFSSDGRKEGHGGYDLYFSRFTGTTWEKPVNLPTPINTEFDDVAFIVNRKNGKSGIYAIKRKDGKRSVYLCMIEITQSNADTMLTLSQYFNKMNTLPLVASKDPVTLNEQIKTDTATSESSTSGDEVLIAKTITTTAVDGKKESELITDKTSAPEKMTVSEPADSDKAEASTEKKKDGIVYRVQFQSDTKPRGSYKVIINGKTYDTFEYQYAGAYRITVGEFSSLSSAIEFQALMRKSGHSQAFVVAFKNDVRSNDPALFGK
ncbi:MAG: TolB family protein [Methanococcaceae archaeon]